MDKKLIQNISDYYLSKAELDRKAGELLAEQGFYNQAIYFASQYMEKFIKSEICQKINIENKHTHDYVNKHSIKDLMLFLIDISVSNEIVKEQLSSQIKEILGRINYDKLHNNLRYPYYSYKDKNFISINYNKSDYDKIVNEIFGKLKNYISQLYRL